MTLSIFTPLLITFSLCLSFALAPLAQADCLTVLQAKIKKETGFFKRKSNHTQYELYKIFQTAQDVLLSYHEYQLDVSPKNRQDEIEKLLKRSFPIETSKEIKKFNAFKYMLTFYKNPNLGYGPYKNNQFLKTLIAINMVNENSCHVDNDLNLASFYDQLKSTYQQIFPNKNKTQALISEKLILTGAKVSNLPTICSYDQDLLSLGSNFLNIDQFLQRINHEKNLAKEKKKNGKKQGLSVTSSEEDKFQILRKLGPPQTSECPTCFGDYYPPEIKELSVKDAELYVHPVQADCGHWACQDCFTSYVGNHCEMGEDLVCMDPACKKPLHISDPAFSQRLAKDQEARKKFDTYVLAKLNRIVRIDPMNTPCKTKNCSTHFKKNGEGDSRQIVCHQCEQATCLYCGSDHPTLFDDEFADIHCPVLLSKAKDKTKIDEAAMKKAGYQNCPFCKTQHQKIEGCSYVKCGNPNCGEHFDFLTGGPWTKEAAERQRGFNQGWHEAIDQSHLKMKKDPSEIRELEGLTGDQRW